MVFDPHTFTMPAVHVFDLSSPGETRHIHFGSRCKEEHLLAELCKVAGLPASSGDQLLVFVTSSEANKERQVRSRAEVVTACNTALAHLALRNNTRIARTALAFVRPRRRRRRRNPSAGQRQRAGGVHLCIHSRSRRGAASC